MNSLSRRGVSRMYDPLLQRFLSADPYLQAPSNAQNHNKYSYCLNNPLMYTDPIGYSVWNFSLFTALAHSKKIIGTYVFDLCY